jgi:uncharacterized membrane protein
MNNTLAMLHGFLLERMEIRRYLRFMNAYAGTRGKMMRLMGSTYYVRLLQSYNLDGEDALRWEVQVIDQGIDQVIKNIDISKVLPPMVLKSE